MKNIKKLSALAISIIMIFSFSGCSAVDDSIADGSSSKSSESSNKNSSGYTEGSIENGVYTTEDYSIELGSDWIITDDTSESGTAVFTLGSGSYSSINIRHESQPIENVDEIPFDDYKEAVVNQFKAMSSYKLTKTKDVEIDGKKAFKIYINMNGSTQMKMLQCYIIDGLDLYVYSFLSTPDEFKKMKSQAEDILKTFKFA